MKDRVLDRANNVAKGIALALAAVSLAAVPAAAQNNSAATAPPTNSSSDIGPGELSNFTLNGTVTRPADRPAATPPPPAANAPSTSPAAPVRANRPVATAPAPDNGGRPTAANTDLFRRPPTLPDASAAPSVGTVPPPIGEVTPATAPETSERSLLPWIVALFAIGGGALLWFGRQRRQGQRFAAAGNAPIDLIRGPAPEPRPDPTAAPPATIARKPLPTTLMPPPRVQPRPDPIIPGGIVSTGLRPWIEVELTPDRALLDEQGAAIAFEVVLYNSGSAAARDVIVEAMLINAGASQDVELSAFFTADSRVSDSIPQIAPYARIPLRSAVRLPRESISEYEYEGRKLFMPMVAVSVRYRWSSGDGQSAAGFLVGQGAAGQEKLAPLRLDRGARSWNGLGVRRYEKGVRR